MYYHYSPCKTDFVPKKVTLGKFKSYAYVTCKFNEEKWVSPSIFERLTGYKPNTQRDSRKELKKAIYNAVDTIDNVPVKGFSFVSYGGNVYGINEFNDNKNVIMRDPRGFEFPITLDEFFMLLKLNGGNMKDNVLDKLECVYAWTSYAKWRYLLPVNHSLYADIIEHSDEVYDKVENTKYLTKRDFIKGHAYLGSEKMPGTYIYMGEHDTYSVDCHIFAFQHKSYNHLDKCLQDFTDETRQKCMIFYKLGAKGLNAYGKFDSDDSPYAVKKSISKLFLKELPEEDGSNFTMYNSSLKSTYANIKDDMEHSIAFNKIDFSSIKRVPMSKELFKKSFNVSLAYHTYSATRVQPIANPHWPFGDIDKRFEIMLSENLGCASLSVRGDPVSGSTKLRYDVNVSDVDTSPQSYSRWSYPPYVGRALFTKHVNDSDEVYDDIKPLYNEMRLENGNLVSDLVSAAFTHPRAMACHHREWEDE